MNIIETKIQGLLVIEPKVFTDDRGWFMESFNQQKFSEALTERGLLVPTFVQDNHSMSKKGVLRGLHFQTAPQAQGKLVQVSQGRVWDVAVDLRPKSDTYGQWVSMELSAENKKQLWIPEGFAHGFLALEDNTHCTYKITNFYYPQEEVCIKWNDPDLAIDWPVDKVESIHLSLKDEHGLAFIKI